MKVIINAASIFKGGAEQVAHSFITECINHPEHHYSVLLRDNIASQLDVSRFPENFTFIDVPVRPGESIFQVWKSNRQFDRLAKEICPDVVISTGGHGFWKPNVPVVGGFNIPHYVYPESPYFDRISPKKKGYWWLKKRFDLYFYRRLDAIVVQTEDVKERLQVLIPKTPIHAVSNTVNAEFQKKNSMESGLPTKLENEFRFLTLSAYYPHKNLNIIHDVIRELKRRGRNEIKFVITLPEDAYQSFSQKDTDGQLMNRGPVPISQCPALYRDCDAMFLPTLLECFSASYAEAMKMERPILTSDLGFAHTVCKDAALYFNPLDPSDIADQIEMVISNAELRKKLVHEGKKEFRGLKTPGERANTFLKIAESLVNQKTDNI